MATPSGTFRRATLGFLSACCLLAIGCTTQRFAPDRPRSWAYAEPENSGLARVLADEAQTSTGRSGFHLLSFGMEALVARLAIADAAQHSIDAQYYIFDADEAGAILTKHLIAAADRGVRVRLLVDDIDVKSDRQLEAMAAHPNIDVRIFNPLRNRAFLLRLPEYVLDLHNSDHRMHNKLFIADSEVSILGGRNVGDDYFDLSGDNGFRDFDLLSVGPVSQQTETAFDQFWNSSRSIPIDQIAGKTASREDFERMVAAIDAQIHPDRGFAKGYVATGRNYLSDLAKDKVGGLLWGFGRVVSEPPRKVAEDVPQDDLVSKRLIQEWDRAQHDVMVECSYFLPGAEGIAAFRKLRERGVAVTVVTSGLEATDVPLVYAAYRQFRPPLLDAGVGLYEFKLHPPKIKAPGKWYRQGSSYSAMHSKVIEFDHQRVWVGSFNLDPRSIKLNTEVAIIAECPALARQLANAINSDLAPTRSWKVEFDPRAPAGRDLVWVGEEQGNPTTLTHDPGSLHARVGVFFWSMVPFVKNKL